MTRGNENTFDRRILTGGELASQQKLTFIYLYINTWKGKDVEIILYSTVDGIPVKRELVAEWEMKIRAACMWSKSADSNAVLEKYWGVTLVINACGMMEIRPEYLLPLTVLIWPSSGLSCWWSVFCKYHLCYVELEAETLVLRLGVKWRLDTAVSESVGTFYLPYGQFLCQTA